MNIDNLQYLGSTIVWDNQDDALHTATSGNAETATPDGKFDTGMVGAMTQSQPVTMPTEPGEYTYFCVCVASIFSGYCDCIVVSYLFLSY